MGVCFYAMLAGYLPFYNSTGKKDIDDKIIAGSYKFPERYKDSSVKSLIERFLIVDPAKRLALNQILLHPWVKRYLPPNPPSEEQYEVN